MLFSSRSSRPLLFFSVATRIDVTLTSAVAYAADMSRMALLVFLDPHTHTLSHRFQVRRSAADSNRDNASEIDPSRRAERFARDIQSVASPALSFFLAAPTSVAVHRGVPKLFFLSSGSLPPCCMMESKSMTFFLSLFFFPSLLLFCRLRLVSGLSPTNIHTHTHYHHDSSLPFPFSRLRLLISTCSTPSSSLTLLPSRHFSPSYQ